MDQVYNTESPLIMHVDLNSCFAMLEQQARPSLRYRPVAVTNRLVGSSCVIACSYEAKARGVKVGMRFDEARILAPGIVMVETDPPKYHYAYQKLINILRSYSPNVTMKSIDEGVIDFHGTEQVNKRSLEDIGREIKLRLKQDIGSYVTCNIGISTNRMLAKTAAGLNKPNGMDRIDHTNLRQVFSTLKLTDFPGIAHRNQHHLNMCNIFTPLQFLDASPFTLRRVVFKSIIGEYWYQRLRGFEVDDVTTTLGTVGRQFVMDQKTNDETIILPRLHHLCQSTGTKLRYNQMEARGLLVWLRYVGGETYLKRQMFGASFYTDQDIYRHARALFDQRPLHSKLSTIGVSCYKLSSTTSRQTSFLSEDVRADSLTSAIDGVNNHFGSFTMTYANALPGKHAIKQKVPFGSVKYFELLCQQSG